MSKRLYLNKTERPGLYLNIALASLYTSILAPYERASQESQRKRLPFPEIPEEILSFVGSIAEGIEYRRLL